MEKRIYISQTIATLVGKYPDLINVLYECGFQEITKPLMLATVAKFMTLKAGATLRNLDLNNVIKTLNEHGYTVIEE